MVYHDLCCPVGPFQWWEIFFELLHMVNTNTGGFWTLRMWLDWRLGFLFYWILFYLNVNTHIWLLAIVLDKSVICTPNPSSCCHHSDLISYFPPLCSPHSSHWATWLSPEYAMDTPILRPLHFLFSHSGKPFLRYLYDFSFLKVALTHNLHEALLILPVLKLQILGKKIAE